MNAQETTLSQEEAQTLRQLLKITAIRGIYLGKKEIDLLLPDQDEVEQFSEGHLNFDAREVYIKPENAKGVVTIPLKEKYFMQDTHEEHEEWYYSSQFRLLQELLGTATFLERLADAMNRRYESLSVGQAEAVIKKYVPTFREDNSVMTSTTRTQIHRLRQKLQKYKKLVDSFFPLLMNENITLEEIAGQMDSYLKYTQAPYFVDDAGMVTADLHKIGDIVKEVSSPKNLRPAERKSREEAKAEIEETRNKLREHGLDPDHREENEKLLDSLEDDEG